MGWTLSRLLPCHPWEMYLRRIYGNESGADQKCNLGPQVSVIHVYDNAWMAPKGDRYAALS